MGTRLTEVLDNVGSNYVFPFFNVKEDVTPEMLRTDMKRLAANGVMGVCIEPHGNKGFAGPGWWAQMDAILGVARECGMRVWLQDEPSFPTGSANNAAVNHPELQKVYLEEQHIDAFGPMRGASFLIDSLIDPGNILFQIKHKGAYGLPKPGESGKPGMGPDILCISACRVVDGNGAVDGAFIDLTGNAQNGVLKWDVPDGHWRIFIVYTLKYGVGRPDYLNLLDSDAVDLLIRELYEPHLERYRDDFGQAFAGFFSDEPEFGNVYDYGNDNSLGRKPMPLPWGREVAEKCSEVLGENAYALLPALWHESGPATAEIRLAFMNVLTRLFERNFSVRVGEWCRANGCEYIGHVVEDMGNHAKLGCGTGHYFRSMTGQDYAGIDLVLQQIRPGLDDPALSWQGGETGGEFFHYGLAKLGSSAAHIDPMKKGRSICEIFAAYGSSLGLGDQKRLFDHMLVRGINSFIPAWNGNRSKDGISSRYDWDPQFRYNHVLAGYVNRLCHLFNGGAHVAPAAVLYHAEAEWCGDYMEFEKPVRALLQNQIDCDVLPSDVFGADSTTFDGNMLRINGETYGALVVPRSEFLTRDVAAFIGEGARRGFPVLFVDAPPRGVVGTTDLDYETLLLEGVSLCRCVSLDELPSALRGLGAYEITASGAPKGLRYHHYRHHDDDDVFMFLNEDPNGSIRTTVEIPMDKPVAAYDAFANRLLCVGAARVDGVTSVALDLHPYESVILVLSDGYRDRSVSEPLDMERMGGMITLDQPWDLYLASRESYPDFTHVGRLGELIDVTSFGAYPDFSGTMRYEATVSMDDANDGAILSLGGVHGTVELWINGVSAGVRIHGPFLFDVSGMIKPGANAVRIEVINTLVHEAKDQFSQYGAIAPSGLLGPVTIHHQHVDLSKFDHNGGLP